MMSKYLKYLYIIVFVFASYFTYAQDVHFTQYYANPLNINPALTGWFNGNCRVAANYREQWKTIGIHPYSTYGISFEKQHYLYTEQINYGAAIVHDNSGDIELQTNMLVLSGSYLKSILDHNFQGGIQIGIVNLGTNTEELTFDSQLDFGEDDMFNQDISSGEGIDENIFYLSTNIGALWSKQLSAKLTPMVGFAFYHLNRPNESLYDIKSADTKVPIRSVFHANIAYKLSDAILLKPGIVYMNQRKATEILIGGNIEYSLDHKILDGFYGGTLFRYGNGQNYDALAAIVGLKVMRFDVGLSYDINLSSLNAVTNNQGALEISVRYLCKSTKVTKVKVSCDRL